MKSVLLTGTESGLGLGMVKYLLKNKKIEHIFATYLILTEVNTCLYCFLYRFVYVIEVRKVYNKLWMTDQ